MKLYFTRHGKTEWNQEMRLQGMMGDSPLLPESFEQITKLGEKLKEIPFEGIYSSPSKRAKLTAEGISKQLTQSTDINYSEGLRELGLGELEGKEISWCREHYPIEMETLRHNPGLYFPEPFNGETYEEMLTRSVKVIEQAVKEHREGPLLFVSHGMTLTGCIKTLIGIPLEETRSEGGLDNNSLSVLDYSDGKFTLETWNDISFLNK